ncbi:phosphonate ABC transporter substrate-binding protein [Noviherbaspirillum sp. Root189]|uniref:phosphonate ABC transporter substrate-binding protein n=1 Tax=Noviherbaspirillum sp. Root189 TaxID=1736487 RepID=UPI00070C28FF|nr:phosphonate ABC transporter substrate-binding protein [Noviherbaspirillum sp. Root189]KRB93138.1 phosphonate ABC transporter substrate-binding protein [Noviherbaspirillum sp. Root189]
MYRTLMSSFAATVLFSFAAASHAQDTGKAINFGFISTESAQNLRQDWQPVLEDMSKRLGVKVNAFFASDYAGIIEGMRFNKVQVAWVGNKSAMEAVDRSNAEVFAQTVNVDGSLGYHSMISVHKDSPYQTLDDVLKNAKSMNFGMGDPNSTSGFLVPSYYVFAKNNIDPKTAFKTVRGANHETNILGVANKQLDAAVHSSDTYERIEARQPDMAKQLRQIWKSPLIAADPIVWRNDLPQEMKQKIKDFLFAYGKAGPDAAREKAQMLKLNFSSFQESSNAQLLPIRQLELFKEKIKIEADAGMNPDTKKAKLDDIARKLSDIAKS